VSAPEGGLPDYYRNLFTRPEINFHGQELFAEILAHWLKRENQPPLPPFHCAISMQNFFLFLLGLSLLTGCAKKEDAPQPAPAPTPAQAATVNIAFDAYATASQPASTESLSLLATKPSYQVFPDRLQVTLEVLSVINTVQEQVVFTLPLSRQKNGLVGTYTLASQPDASLGETLVAYTRPSGSTSAFSNVYGTNSARLEGTFVVSSYDAARQLLSGSYSVKALNVRGPFSFLGVGSVGDPRRTGDLRLSGTFQEIVRK
jgi:hypothetical protein